MDLVEVIKKRRTEAETEKRGDIANLLVELLKLCNINYSPSRALNSLIEDKEQQLEVALRDPDYENRRLRLLNELEYLQSIKDCLNSEKIKR